MSRCSVIFLGDRVAFFSVLPQKLKEALVAASLNASDLEVVPSIREERLDVGLELREGLSVLLCALSTDEGAESDVAVAA